MVLGQVAARHAGRALTVLPGVYLAHKPVGPSSFQLVHALMEEVRLAGIRRDKLPVSHGGALDPFAHGLVLLLAGQATRLMELMHPLPKEYLAEIAWGVETDNGDHLGKAIAEGDAKVLTPALLDAALARCIGFHDQVPPLHSNKRVGGERAYQLAWRGETAELPPQRVYLHEARFLAHALPRSSTLSLVCRGGYYVRSLARDLGRALGCRAHLAGLSRGAIGPHRDPGPGRRELVRGPQLFPWCRTRLLSDGELELLKKLQPIAPGELLPAGWSLPPGFPDPRAPVRGLHGGALWAMLHERDGALHAAPLLRRAL